MKCSNHPEVDAAGACVYCGKLFCQSCLVEVNGKNYCKADVGRVVAEAKEQGRASSVEQIVVTHRLPPEAKSGLKTATKVLIIIFGIIGILWGIFAPMALGLGAAMAAFSDTSSSAASDSQAIAYLATGAGKLVGSLFFIIAGMVLGLISSSTKTKRTATIVLGSLVIVMGVVSSILLQFVSGPVYVLCGILALVAGLKQNAFEKET